MRTLEILALLIVLATAFASAAFAGAQVSGEAAERTFLIYVGEPGLAVEVRVTSEDDEARFAAVSDAGGNLRLTLPVAPGESLHIRARDTVYALDVVRIVPAEEAAVPILWDLSAALERAPPPEPAADEKDAALEDVAPPVEDPCRDHRSLLCRRQAWTRFEEAYLRRDCEAALQAYGRLVADYPELTGSGDAVAAFGEAHLECAGDTVSERRQERLRRAVELLEGFADGELWCRPRESRLLALAYEGLGNPATAAASAGRARTRCASGETAALEWEFYFRVQLAETETAAALAAAAPRRLGLFLSAWLELVRGECGTSVELEADGELPCRGLPRDFCSRRYGRILLGCGETPADQATAARYLLASLPVDPQERERLPDGGRHVLVLAAEAELMGGRYDAAARLYDEVLSDPGYASQTALRFRRAEALAFAGGAEADRAAFDAYEELRTARDEDAVAAVVLNNLCVLRARLGATLADPSFREDLAALERALPGLAEEPYLELLLRHSLLTLRIHLLERDTSMGAAEKLDRLKDLRGPFKAHQAELAAYGARGDGMIEVAGGRYGVVLLEVD